MLITLCGVTARSCGFDPLRRQIKRIASGEAANLRWSGSRVGSRRIILSRSFAANLQIDSILNLINRPICMFGDERIGVVS
jgi:hypothetical protein